MQRESHDPLAGIHVLVVEDTASIRRLMHTMLETEGATVVEASTGREAIELARVEAFDVVLTDLGLPDISGETVIAEVRAVSRGRTRIAVVSGAHPDDLAHALEAGAERAFAKPVEWNDLLRYVAGRTACAGARISER
ncbi:MAG: response regulator [Candidatus Rokubacteria bacterium]|nr:response regulator [Candidatus Rokubacteria bacterium]